MDTKSTEEERDTYPIEYAMYSKVYVYVTLSLLGMEF